MRKCPKCGKKTEEYNYEGIKLSECENCGYDESEKYEELPTEKTQTKHRQAYKTGGSTRTRK
ncbi:hypothetical protein HY483_02380 [Candidatus Woesearchaeota archaeon]|nr:hypothetical protein [Candidatus Woesearchaeota archaeon]